MNRIVIWVALLLGSLFFTANQVAAQGTAFTYQGRMNDNGDAATGAYDLKFALYDAALNGNAISVPQTNFATGITNGLFTSTLDFGSVFTGTNYWLALGVRTNGNTNAFTLLLPRQPLTPVPYAIFANSASNLLGRLAAAQLIGTLPSAQVSGNYTGSVNFTNATNSFNGTFFGNGATLTNLNATALASGTLADARLSTNVPLRNANQTFSGINTFTNWANTFVGNFSGNGLVQWVAVSNTTNQAVRDVGYLLLSAGLTTVKLPLSANLQIGDIVRISGAGAGGWLVAENSGQSVMGNFASYANSYLAASPNLNNYSDVAAAADGQRLFAVGNGFVGVYASSDAGRTWNPSGNLVGNWFSVACSANGKIVYAEPNNVGGTIQKSTNSGLTWSATGATSAGSFIACTADGSTLFNANIACSGNGTYLARLIGGSISVSTNAGASWVGVPAPPVPPTCLAASSDCARLVAGVSNGLLYATANVGVTWTAITTTNQYWSGAWMSPDGSRLAGTVSTGGSFIGGVYNYVVAPQPNTVSTNSTISGSQGAAVELQFIGNQQFMPVSSAGLLWAN